ncbi:MAG: hypothetical protein AAF614_41360 [Chloroflexota bacterium]
MLNLTKRNISQTLITLSFIFLLLGTPTVVPVSAGDCGSGSSSSVCGG